MSESDVTIPEHGGTLSLKLRDAGAVSVSWDAELAASGAVWRGQVSLTISDGTVALGDLRKDGAPEWLCDDLRSLLRAQWRSRGQGWTRRLTRWREEPVETDESE